MEGSLGRVFQRARKAEHMGRILINAFFAFLKKHKLILFFYHGMLRLI